MNIGIMQGRLVPPENQHIQCFPREKWAQEFDLARQANIASIEWIYDLYGADINPLATDEGIEKIKSFSVQFDVKVLSVCADYFIDKPLLRENTSEINERLRTLVWLIHRGHLLGINHLVLPFIDNSQINTDYELSGVIAILKRILHTAEETGVEIHLETSLTPDRFAWLLGKLVHPMLKVNYDSGNSASLGFQLADEFAAYGERIGSVHIKDRLLGGNSVPLGTGATSFNTLFTLLNKTDYAGDFILQASRGTAGDEVNWAKKNRDFLLSHFNRGQEA